eukprot:746454-Hanusia_phi.AAC.3
MHCDPQPPLLPVPMSHPYPCNCVTTHPSGPLAPRQYAAGGGVGGKHGMGERRAADREWRDDIQEILPRFLNFLLFLLLLASFLPAHLLLLDSILIQEATMSEVEYLDHEEGVVLTASCDPSSCFLSNQRLDMTIVCLARIEQNVGVPTEFCTSCKLKPVTVHNERLLSGDEVVMVSKWGAEIDVETTISTRCFSLVPARSANLRIKWPPHPRRLLVEEVGESEVFLSPVDHLTSGVLGSPIFKDMKLVAIVVKLEQEAGGLRALLTDTIFDKLKKVCTCPLARRLFLSHRIQRQQLEHALGKDGSSSIRGVEQSVRTRKVGGTSGGVATLGVAALAILTLTVVFLRLRR